MRWWPPLGFFALAVVLRLPFFFVDVIDWDESTFILMGSAWADGHLPYLELWDNKPPLCFAPFAVVYALFGTSIIAVRLLGLFCVVGAALIVWQTASKTVSAQAGIIAGFACVVLVTFASRGQATMSETVALIPVSASLWFLLVHGDRPMHSAAAGACLSVASLVRLNLIVVALSALGWLVVKHRDRTLPFTVGGVVPWLLVAVPYALSQQLDVAVASVFVAPLVYALSGLGLLSVIVPAAVPPLFWCLAVATAISILLSGGGSAHYWIQIHPFSAIVVGAALDRGLSYARKTKPILLAACLLLVPIAGAFSDSSWVREVQTMGRVHGPSLELAEYLEDKDLDDGDVLLLADHLAYWWLGIYPPHRMATHPSSMFRTNLVRAATGLSPAEVLEEIFDSPPRYIVRKEEVRHLDSAPSAKKRLDDELASNYVLEHRIGELMIYVRPSGVSR